MTEQEKYLEAYYENESNANKHMAYALAFTAGVIFIVWILYLIPPIFNMTRTARIVSAVTLPIDILLLLSPLFMMRKGKATKKRWFKYYVIGIFLFVMGAINVFIPRQGVLGWAICIIITNHYYNPKLGKITFGLTLGLMFICIYLAMFFGEFDPYLLKGEVDESTNLSHHFADPSITFPDTAAGRYDYIIYLNSTGTNRFVSVLTSYYLPRAVIIVIIFFVSNSLNKRTYNLLVQEIRVGIDHASQSKELEIAGEIQLSVLPESYKSSKDIEIIANLKPSKEVGGDFYDYYFLDNDHIAFVIGDVSGKGSPAAMFMMKTITCFKNFISVDKTPSQILKEVNAAVFKGNTNEMFVTAFLGILDLKTGAMKFANAGHNAPVIGAPGHYKLLQCNSGFLMGVLEDIMVKDEEITLNPGDLILMYTDGVTEARNPDGAFYGEHRMLRVLNQKKYDSIFDMHYELKDDIEAFVDKADQADDITYLTILYRAGEFKHGEIIVPAKRESLEKVMPLVNKLSIENKLEDWSNKIRIIVDEVFSNIAKYAYNGQDGDIYFRVTFSVEKQEMSLTFIDKGVPFNQLEINEKIIDQNYMEKKEGSLGIHIVKNLATCATYNHINGKNILVIKVRQ